MSVLSWNEIRARAASFAVRWQTAGYEKGQTHLFYQEFFQLFGMPLRRFASFEVAVQKPGKKRGFIDLLWPGMLLIEQKSAGRDLARAREQAFAYFHGLNDEELPRYLLLSDFQRFELLDLQSSTEIYFTLPELPHYVEHFAFIRGDEIIDLEVKKQLNIKAAQLLGNLHLLLKKGGYSNTDLHVLMVRLLFCLFADNTGIFPEDRPFLHLIKNRSAEGGRDLGRLLLELFEVLNTHKDNRQSALDEELAQFPYINGALFKKAISTPSFDRLMRQVLLTACEFDWSTVSPAIFGSLFQEVLEERRSNGAHYTSEAHILRLIKPFFLDKLDAEFEEHCKFGNGKQPKEQRKRFLEFHNKLASLTFFDPACGCGNFLVVAYQKLRALETALLKRLYPLGAPHFNNEDFKLSRIYVHQFYGIEIDNFAVHIAQVALWMTDHLCNIELGKAFGLDLNRIPLEAKPYIVCADALEINWHNVLPAEQCSYVLGNPPFVGAKYQSPEQRAQVRRTADLGKTGGTLDYVCAWFIKAAEYVQSTQEGNPPKIAFVSTNSITQGEQVAQLWPILFNRYNLEIVFAHRTFAWTSEARGAAHVHVVIIGLCSQDFEPKEKRLFHYQELKGEPLQTTHKKLSPYLIDASTLNNPHLVIKEEPRSLMNYPPLITGSKPIDDGNYIFTDEQRSIFYRTSQTRKPLCDPLSAHWNLSMASSVGYWHCIRPRHNYCVSYQKPCSELKRLENSALPAKANLLKH